MRNYCQKETVTNQGILLTPRARGPWEVCRIAGYNDLANDRYVSLSEMGVLIAVYCSYPYHRCILGVCKVGNLPFVVHKFLEQEETHHTL